MKKLTFAIDEGGDWQGLYIDDVLVLENHTIRAEDVLDFLDIQYEYQEVDMYALDRRRLPKSLKYLREEA